VRDADLRELERSWRETGSLEDGAAYLRARVQRGDLEQSKLELAARLGALAPRRVLGWEAPSDLAFDQPLEQLLEGYPEAVRRGAAALAWRLLPIWESDEVRRQVERNHADPRVSHGLYTPPPSADPLPPDWRGWARRLAEIREGTLAAGGPPDPQESELYARLESLPTSPYESTSFAHQNTPLTLFRCGLLYPGPRMPTDARNLLLASLTLDQALREGPMTRRDLLAEIRAAQTGLAAWRAGAEVLHAELVPWLLGHSDPLRERVQARAGERPAG
jgi:hypothetical protein